LTNDPKLAESVIKVLKDAWADGIAQCTLFYILSQPLVKWLFKDGKFYENHKKPLKLFMASYNFAMSVYSLVTFCFCFYALRQTGLYNPTDCGSVFRNWVFERCAWVFTWSKAVEFLDTYFLLLMGKSVGWLNFYHHAFAGVDMWILWKYQNEGIWIFVQFNSFIHTLMYAYYGMTVLGKSLGPLKWIMTALQLTQLTVGNSLSIPYIWHKCYRADIFRMISWLFNMWYISFLIILFAEFFYSTYLSPKPKKTEKGNEKGKSVHKSEKHKDE